MYSEHTTSIQNVQDTT